MLIRLRLVGLAAGLLLVLAGHQPAMTMNNKGQLPPSASLLARPARPRGYPEGGSSNTAWQEWVNGLAAQGCGVTQGGAFLVTVEQCALFEAVFDSCFGNNPASPYIVPQPPVGDGYVDPFYATSFSGTGPTGASTNLIYRMSDNDALITLLKLPPKAAYLAT